MSAVDRSFSRVAPLALAFAIAAASEGVAHAEAAPAQVAFEEGLRLFDAGHIAEACAKLEESAHLDRAAGTVLNLARCYEAQGRLSSAWNAYGDAAELARGGKRDAWVTLAERRRAALEPRVPLLVVRASGVDVVVTVSVNGRATPPAIWERGAPVDPGEVHVDARAPGKRASVRDVVVHEGEHLVIDLGALEDEARPVAAGRPTNAEQRAPDARGSASEIAAAPPSPAVDARRGNAQRVAGVATAAVGAGAIGVGVAFGLDAIFQRAQAGSLCPDKTQCTNLDGAHAADVARRSATISTAAWIAGGVFVAGGAVLYFTAPTTAPRGTGAAAPAWRVGVTPSSVFWERRF